MKIIKESRLQETDYSTWKDLIDDLGRYLPKDGKLSYSVGGKSPISGFVQRCQYKFEPDSFHASWKDGGFSVKTDKASVRTTSKTIDILIDGKPVVALEF